MILRTERLVLRDFVEDDWRAMHAYRLDARYQRYYAAQDLPRTEADSRAFVQMFLDGQAESPRTKFQLAITLPDNDTIVGNCGVRVAEPGATGGDVGCELNPEYWGRGYATEATRAMLDYGFEVLGLHRIAAETLDDNLAARRVLEKLGMVVEGRLREDRFIDGRWHDTVLYAMLKSEYRSQPGMVSTERRDE